MISNKISPISQGSNKFAFELYMKLMKTKQNIFFSPFSISSAIAMVYAGAKEETAKQIEEVMHYTFNKNRLHVEYEKFINKFLEERENHYSKFILANAQWIRKGVKLLESYTFVIENNYKGILVEIDLSDEEKTRELINGWVKEKTEGKISNIVDNIHPVIQLMITNAIYFKDMWQKTFDSTKTKEEPFYLSKTDKIQVDLMTKKQNYPFGNYPTFQQLQIPYKDSDLSLIIFLPRDTERLPDLEKKLANMNIDELLYDIQPQEVEIFIPKFKFETEMKLSEELQEMGMKEPFASNANFSGITETPLTISDVVHKAFIEVNEEGTEAAAATRVDMVLGFGGIPKKEKNIFRADHPFLFMIYSWKTNLILFMGRVLNPKNEE
ncbi:MAG: serpin family protein [Asgard group archaeon]|nr:serpin family protein [Asgard group archaeon]